MDTGSSTPNSSSLSQSDAEDLSGDELKAYMERRTKIKRTLLLNSKGSEELFHTLCNGVSS